MVVATSAILPVSQGHPPGAAADVPGSGEVHARPPPRAGGGDSDGCTPPQSRKRRTVGPGQRGGVSRAEQAACSHIPRWRTSLRNSPVSGPPGVSPVAGRGELAQLASLVPPRDGRRAAGG